MPIRPLILVCLVITACSHSSSSSPGVSPSVVLQAQGRSLRVAVEVVRTPESRERGLMFRRQLAEYQGMLFIFEQQEQQSFWMKNTYLPLDMIFIDEGMKVVGIVKNAEPLTTTSRRVEGPSRFVLEVIGGFTDRHQVKAGSRVSFEGIEI